MSYHAFVGFDGFVDRIARIVRERHGEQVVPFADMPSFAERIRLSSGVSADLELQVLQAQPGGNAPIMARELARLGGTVTCAASVGAHALHPAFSTWGKHVHFLPIGEPCDTLALEFDDGKIMLPDLQPLDSITWPHIKACCGEALKKAAASCSLFALVNWSLPPHSSEIWQGFRDEYLYPYAAGRKPTLFFDLADPSKHSFEKMRQCLQLIRSFRTLGRVVLGLNENEARCLCRALGRDDLTFSEMAQLLFSANTADIILIHPRHGCQAIDQHGTRFLAGDVVEKPVCSTGGGDAFNAGFCHSLMTGHSVDEAVKAGMRQSHLRVAGLLSDDE